MTAMLAAPTVFSQPLGLPRIFPPGTPLIAAHFPHDADPLGPLCLMYSGVPLLRFT